MKNYILIPALAALFIACDKNDNGKPSSPVALNDTYTITDPGLYPEGIDYDFKNERFLLSSLQKGAVYAMDAKGNVKVFATSDKMVLPTGVYTDEGRNRLIVANADLGISQKSTQGSAGSVATVSIFNLTTGALIKEIDLRGFTPHAGSCPNDVAVDADGNIYITDSFSPLIYKIDGSYSPSVFANNPLFAAPSGSFGLNGIVFHPDGYFLIAKTNTSKLLKVSLSNPEMVTEVSGMAINYPDGIEFNKNNELVIVENGLGAGKSHTFASSNGWVSATKVSETNIGKDEFPTTAALASNGHVYIVNSKLGKLLGGDKAQSTFAVQKID